MKPIEKLNSPLFIGEDEYNIIFKGRKMNPFWPEDADTKINEIVDVVNELQGYKTIKSDETLKCLVMEEHIHDKCYSPMVLASNPYQLHWICRICGEQGTDKGEYYDFGEYDRTIEKFKAEPPAE